MTYFEYLKELVVYFDSPTKHDLLLQELYSTPYVAMIDRDMNRILDGIAIQKEYKVYGMDIIEMPCSFFEFLIGIARRMNFVYGNIYEDRTKDCFWTLVRNMGLYDFDDTYFHNFGIENTKKMVLEAMDRVIYRTYGKDGTGGLFPLQNPRENQRNVEIWYQMNQYLAEAMSEEGRL